MRDSAIEKSYVYQVPAKQKAKFASHNIFKFLSNLLFILLLAFFLILLFYNLYNKRYGKQGEVPIVNAYVIVSPSMVPTINVLDAVVAIRPNIDKLKYGDIITFDSGDARYDDLTVTHRILKVVKDSRGTLFNTKGDNNTTPDATLVESKDVLGKVVFVIPFLGYLQMFLTKFYGWILLVVLPCLAMIGYDVYKLSGAIRRSKITKDVSFEHVEIPDDEVLLQDEVSVDYHDDIPEDEDEDDDETEEFERVSQIYYDEKPKRNRNRNRSKNKEREKEKEIDSDIELL